MQKHSYEENFVSFSLSFAGYYGGWFVPCRVHAWRGAIRSKKTRQIGNLYLWTDVWQTHDTIYTSCFFAYFSCLRIRLDTIKVDFIMFSCFRPFTFSPRRTKSCHVPVFVWPGENARSRKHENMTKSKLVVFLHFRLATQSLKCSTFCLFAPPHNKP